MACYAWPNRIRDGRYRWGDEPLQVFTGDALPDRDRRRRSVAIEPMSEPANAFTSDPADVALAPADDALRLP